jgi:hypothetical protein
MSFVRGMPSMTIAVDSNTTFQDFDRITKPNNISGMATGQICLTRIQLMTGGTLHADKVRFESKSSQVMEQPAPNRTRLIVRGRAAPGYSPYGLPLWVAKLTAPWAHAFMERNSCAVSSGGPKPLNRDSSV